MASTYEAFKNGFCRTSTLKQIMSLEGATAKGVKALVKGWKPVIDGVLTGKVDAGSVRKKLLGLGRTIGY